MSFHVSEKITLERICREGYIYYDMRPDTLTAVRYLTVSYEMRGFADEWD